MSYHTTYHLLVVVISLHRKIKENMEFLKKFHILGRASVLMTSVKVLGHYIWELYILTWPSLYR